MARTHTDREWEYFARTDPYWAVITKEKYRRKNLTAQAVEEFFAQGENYIAFVLDAIRRQIATDFAPCTALDFGCGVGRLILPLARRCQRVVGLDVADTMLQEARQRSAALGLSNVHFLKSDDQLSALEGTFDLVHSFIVFQHIPCSRGEHLFRLLLERLNDGGVGVMHFTYAQEAKTATALGTWLYGLTRGIWRGGRRFLQALGMWKPTMQMNAYLLNSLFRTLQQAGVRRLHVEYTNHGGCLGVLLFFQKQAGDSYRT